MKIKNDTKQLVEASVDRNNHNEKSAGRLKVKTNVKAGDGYWWIRR